MSSFYSCLWYPILLIWSISRCNDMVLMFNIYLMFHSQITLLMIYRLLHPDFAFVINLILSKRHTICSFVPCLIILVHKTVLLFCLEWKSQSVFFGWSIPFVEIVKRRNKVFLIFSNTTAFKLICVRPWRWCTEPAILRCVACNACLVLFMWLFSALNSSSIVYAFMKFNLSLSLFLMHSL